MILFRLTIVLIYILAVSNQAVSKTYIFPVAESYLTFSSFDKSEDIEPDSIIQIDECYTCIHFIFTNINNKNHFKWSGINWIILGENRVGVDEIVNTPPPRSFGRDIFPSVPLSNIEVTHVSLCTYLVRCRAFGVEREF